MDSPVLTADDNGALGNNSRPTFYIGHHDSKRTEASPQLLQQAQDSGVSICCKMFSNANADQNASMPC